MSSLFDPISLREVTISNRIFLPPMCQYMCEARDGVPTDWHLMHYGARAAGGFGLVVTEATAVLPEGRISPEDCGIWNSAQTESWARIVDFCHQQGAVMGVQLAHAGRKASVYRAHSTTGRGSVPHSDGGWQTVAPSAVSYPGLAEPLALDEAGINRVIESFVTAAQRADQAGFDVVELHAAHGYLLFEFLSPLSNRRTDQYGGDFAGRTRLLIEVVDAVRAVWPAGKPLFVRLSATEWVPDGWSVEESTELAGLLADHGVDLVDVSSGGNVPANIADGPGYQVPLARAVRAAGLPVSAVGRITEPAQAQAILDEGSADAVMLGRAALREPSWPQRAAAELGVAESGRYPAPYLRGRWPAAPIHPERA